MINLMNTVKILTQDKKGVTALEYGIIAGAVALTVAAAFSGLFGALQTKLAGITF